MTTTSSTESGPSRSGAWPFAFAASTGKGDAMSDKQAEYFQDDRFAGRHIGPSANEIATMLKALGMKNVDELIDQTVPKGIRLDKPLSLPEGVSESLALAKLTEWAGENRAIRTFIGMGYNDTKLPGVIQRNVLENPGWYTQYTPYQAEIAQGRLEALLNFQTMVGDLTGLPLANASLLDEATAAAEAMSLSYAVKAKDAVDTYLVDADCHPQTLAVIRTRARPLGIRIETFNPDEFAMPAEKPFGVFFQNPASDGAVRDLSSAIKAAKDAKVIVTVAADPLSLCLVKSPGAMGADIAVGSTQRFGVPMGYGGPHAAYFATREEYMRKIPGRIIGVSKDSKGRIAARMALQTREQHIRRDKATSNICTSQVLLAIIAGFYGVFHGPDGLKRIAGRAHMAARLFATGLKAAGTNPTRSNFFDAVTVDLGPGRAADAVRKALDLGFNIRDFGDGRCGVQFDELTTLAEVSALLSVFDAKLPDDAEQSLGLDGATQRQEEFMTNAVFHDHHSETEMLRYIRKLESRDLSLTRSMIPLGSCTMKLNATAELQPITWPQLTSIHPFAPPEQALGYRKIITELERLLAEITGFDAISMQPNSGAQGEYAGLLVIRAYHESRGDNHRNICLIPQSAHGTNPASAVMAGMKVVVIKCDKQGNVDIEDLQAKAEQHKDNLSSLMITYPSTHGVFEESVQEICEIVHARGGQVYMDGANLNAQVGVCRPGDFGPDVCHLNLHKTFCIPHGGGGPGMGPIGVKKHLKTFLPSHPVVPCGGSQSLGTIAAAPWGSPLILPISLMYIWMMGEQGLREATEVAILNANYMAKRLDPHFPVLYRGREGTVAHECIIDLRPMKASAGVEAEDVAKRLIDYGYHAPTMSWPVAGTMMIEPTESESLPELDRFCDAMIAIREEIAAVENGEQDRKNNVLKNSPHTAEDIASGDWQHEYTREQAAYPVKWVREHKFWPVVSRVDNAYGDRNLVCTCAPLEAYED